MYKFSTILFFQFKNFLFKLNSQVLTDKTIKLLKLRKYTFTVDKNLLCYFLFYVIRLLVFVLIQFFLSKLQEPLFFNKTSD